MVAGWLEVDGKRFRLHSRHNRKSTANDVKQRFKNDSYCRIIPYHNTQGKKRYAVYLRRK